MPRKQDRTSFEGKPRATTGVPEAQAKPRNLADSPTVNDPDQEVSPATRARAMVPGQPQPGLADDFKGHPVRDADPDPAAVMREREPDTSPGSPLRPGLESVATDEPSPGIPAPDVTRERLPRRERANLSKYGEGMPEHTGDIVGMDETSGTSDRSAEGERGGTSSGM
ncbi:MAG: hypothetical protein ACTHNK_07615 [Thermomicrobiales bacterium]